MCATYHHCPHISIKTQEGGLSSLLGGLATFEGSFARVLVDGDPVIPLAALEFIIHGVEKFSYTTFICV